EHTEIYTLSLHDALPISGKERCRAANHVKRASRVVFEKFSRRFEEIGRALLPRTSADRRCGRRRPGFSSQAKTSLGASVEKPLAAGPGFKSDFADCRCCFRATPGGRPYQRL